MNKDNNGVTITLPDNGMCALVKKVDGRYEIDTGRVEGKDVFLGPQPDPETGLVPCGCGGKAKCLHYLTPGGDYAVKCGKCKIMTDWFNSPEDAIKAFNTAMGYKEDEE